MGTVEGALPLQERAQVARPIHIALPSKHVDPDIMENWLREQTHAEDTNTGAFQANLPDLETDGGL
jgi:hypothetical protein